MEILANFKSPNISGRHLHGIDTIIIHQTIGLMPGLADWLCSKDSEVSYHYVISLKGEIYQFVPEEMKAWHAGKSFFDIDRDGIKDSDEYSLNLRSIGIAMEGIKPEYPDIQQSILLDLTSDVCIRRNITPMNVLGHKEVSGWRKTDPAGFDMRHFRHKVFMELSAKFEAQGG